MGKDEKMLWASGTLFLVSAITYLLLTVFGDMAYLRSTREANFTMCLEQTKDFKFCHINVKR